MEKLMRLLILTAVILYSSVACSALANDKKVKKDVVVVEKSDADVVKSGHNLKERETIIRQFSRDTATYTCSEKLSCKEMIMDKDLCVSFYENIIYKMVLGRIKEYDITKEHIDKLTELSTCYASVKPECNKDNKCKQLLKSINKNFKSK